MTASAPQASYGGRVVHLGLSAQHNAAQDPPPRQGLGQMATFWFSAGTQRVKLLAQANGHPQTTIASIQLFGCHCRCYLFGRLFVVHCMMQQTQIIDRCRVE